MENLDINKTLHDLVIAVTREKKSYTARLAFLRRIRANYLDIINKNSFDLQINVSIEQGIICDSLGLTSGEPRITFIDLSTKMNLEIIKTTDSNVLEKKLNNVFTKNNIQLAGKFTIDQIRVAIERINLLGKVEDTIHTFGYWEEFMAILPYSSHYMKMPDEQITTDLNNLIVGHTDLKVLIIDEKSAKERAVETLGNSGHLVVGIEDKTAGTLMTVIERTIIAGNAVLMCRQEKKSTDISPNDLLDKIAAYWLKEEEIGLQNTSDYIIPPPF